MKPPVPTRPTLSVLLPMRDEAAVAADFVAACRDRLAGRVAFELIAIDDASTDGTGDRLAEAASRIPELSVVRLAGRIGRGASVRLGAERAAGDFVAYLDTDFQHDPADLLRALALARRGADLVCGLRLPAAAVPRARRFLSAGFRRVAGWLAGLPCRDPLCGFKFFRRAALADLLAATRDPGWFFDFEIAWRARRRGYALADLPLRFDRPAPGRASKVAALRLAIRYLRQLAALRGEGSCGRRMPGAPQDTASAVTERPA